MKKSLIENEDSPTIHGALGLPDKEAIDIVDMVARMCFEVELKSTAIQLLNSLYKNESFVFSVYIFGFLSQILPTNTDVSISAKNEMEIGDIDYVSFLKKTIIGDKKWN